MAVYVGIINRGNFVSSDGYTLRDVNSSSLNASPATNKFRITLNGVPYRLNVKLPVKESE